MDSNLWATIRRLFEVEKLSKSAIAERLNLHRRTVRRALESSHGPPADGRGRPSAGSKLDSFKSYIAERVKTYPELSGAKLLTEIKAQGYAGGKTVLLGFLRALRPRAPRAFLRLETRPGEFAQVDWANIGSLLIGNAKRKLSCFVMVLSYSRMIYIEFTLSQRLEDFLQCHVNAFEFFGGVPDKINYDNLKTVVLSRVGKEIRFHPRFMDFAGFYLFDPVPCGVRQAHEKGKVESGIKFVRSSLLAGREIVSFWELQKDGVLWRDGQANVRLHGSTHERPIDRFETERSHLHPLPSPGFDCSRLETVQATSQALVHFDANRYSVPYPHAGNSALTLRAKAHEIEIYADKPDPIAVHARSYEKHRVFENPAHYAGLLAERKKAKAAKQTETFLGLAPECAFYLQGLVHTELHVSSHIGKIFDLIHRYGKAEVMSALLRALEFKAFGASYLERIIHQRRAAKNLPEPTPIVLTKKPEWNHASVQETNLALYDDLFEENSHV